VARITPLSSAEASAITQAHGLGPCLGIEPLSAGSVNSNFFLEVRGGRRFLRIYEEQGLDGVAYEWALLEHLVSKGLPVPRLVPGTEPGALRVAGKPTALFEVASGETLCHRLVGLGQLEAVGRFLGQSHRACADFGWRRGSRFDPEGLRRRIEGARRAGDLSLEAPLDRIEAVLDQVQGVGLALPRGVIHGDLFRDNLLFEGEALSCVIDWESAADGALLQDLVIAWLALGYDEEFVAAKGRALFAGYQAERPLAPAEWAALRALAMGAAARFATTRITDFHLRPGLTGFRDYRRFLARLEAIAAMDEAALRALLGG